MSEMKSKKKYTKFVDQLDEVEGFEEIPLETKENTKDYVQQWEDKWKKLEELKDKKWNIIMNKHALPKPKIFRNIFRFHTYFGSKRRFIITFTTLILIVLISWVMSLSRSLFFVGLQFLFIILIWTPIYSLPNTEYIKEQQKPFELEIEKIEKEIKEIDTSLGIGLENV